MNPMNIQACAFVSLSDITRKHLLTHGEISDFWDQFVNNAPFSWGDNNRSLVIASAVAEHCQNCLEGDSPPVQALLQSLRDLEDLYIDLES
jgi:hypothetical protein